MRANSKRYLPQGRALAPAPAARDCGAEPRGIIPYDVCAHSVMPHKRGATLVSLDNKTSRAIGVAAALVAIVMSVGCVPDGAINAGGAGIANEMMKWELFTFPYSNFHDPQNTLDVDVKVNFNTDEGTYPPSVTTINAKLTNVAIPGELTCGTYFTLVKYVGQDWRVVPFNDDIGFNDIAILLTIGQSENFTITEGMFSAGFAPGKYRVVTDVWYGDDPRETLTVWADFHISESESEGQTMPPSAEPPFITIEDEADATEADMTTVSREDWGAFYIQTFSSYLMQDTGLNEGIDYIAIDLSSLEYASETEKESVADYFSSAYVPVIDADLEKLIEEGLFDEDIMGLPDGLLLQIQSVTRSGDEIIIEGMKYRSGLGANGFETRWTANADGTWTMHDTFMKWIA